MSTNGFALQKRRDCNVELQMDTIDEQNSMISGAFQFLLFHAANLIL